MNWLLRPDRLWTFGGLAGAVALSALAWFLLIGPQRDETVSVEEQTAVAEGQAVVEQRKLAKLNAEFADKDRYASELAANLRALPTAAATGDLLRELQTAGDRTGVSVTSLSAGSPAELKNAPNVASVTITIAASGTLQQLRTFLDQVQRVQPRAMLVFNVSFAPSESGGGITGSGAQLTITAQVFVSITKSSTTNANPSASASAAAAD